MAEAPVLMKKRKEEVCIVHYAQNNNDLVLKPLTVETFRTIQRSQVIRQEQESDALRRDDICCKIPQEFAPRVHAAHQWCYKQFTNVSKCISADKSHSSNVRKSNRTSDADKYPSTLFPQDSCLFCGKGRKKFHGVKEGLVKCLTLAAEQSIKSCAARKQDFDLLGKIDGVDLRAQEARYHESCRRPYVRTPCSEQESQTQSVDSEGTSAAPNWYTGQKSAHEEAFRYLCEHVENSIIDGAHVERISMLRERYLEYMHAHSPEYYNADYQTHKLKGKLQSHYGDALQFWQPNVKSELVYSATIGTGDAVEVAFEAATSETRILEEAAAILRRHIQSGYCTSESLPWPPSASHLTSQTVTPPDSLVNFLALLISGKNTDKSSDKTAVLTSSLAADLCSAATRGQWKMPKHVLLGMTVHHMTGSAQLVTMLNRYGHCQSYSAVLELETAVANQIQQNDSPLPANISPTDSEVVHLCWDNFDINEETPSGAGTTHTTHGIVIQEISSNQQCTASMDSLPRTRERSLKFAPANLEPCYSKKRAEPNVADSSVPAHCAAVSVSPLPLPSVFSDLTWIMCRGLCNKHFTVPEWSGWISQTSSNADTSQSVIGYLAPILHPITESATVQQCLLTSMQVTSSLQQTYTFVTMDLAAAKIAYDIIWGNPDKFSKVVIHIGAFHAMCSYMGALGKMVTGSGFEDIVVDSGICASGSLNQVLSGKHYNRALRVHQLLLDALERLMLQEFLASISSDVSDVCEDAVKILSDLAKSPGNAALQNAEDDAEYAQFAEQYKVFRESVRCGKSGKTAQFWMSYMDCVWTLLRFQQAIKENDFALYVYSLRQLCCLMFSSDHVNYARYLPFYYNQLQNLCHTHPGAELLLQNRGFSVSRSNVPACRNAVDLTIEQTINRSAKTRGGIIGFSRRLPAYYRWCVTRHTRATYTNATLEQLDMLPDSADVHKSTRPSQMKRSETDVQKLLAAFQQYINPFTIEPDQQQVLFCLSSGRPASDAVTQDLLNYCDCGNAAAETFIETRLTKKTVPFQQPLKKLKLQTFRSMAVKRILTSKQKKTIQVTAERNLLGRLLMLSQEHDISLELMFQYPLGPIPWSLATADGGLVKTNKSQLLHYLESTTGSASVTPQLGNMVCIIDGNAQVQSMVHLPETFEDLAFEIFRCMPKAGTVHFVTDTYREQSIKQMERDLRGSSSEHLIGGPRTKLPRDFKSFMRNSCNKRRLIQFLLQAWQTQRYAPLLCGRQLFYVCEDQCVLLESTDGYTVTATPVQELFSSQEEADTRIILHSLYASANCAAHHSICVRSPDTDVLVLLLFYAAQIQQALLFDTGTGNNRRHLDVHGIASAFGEGMVKALPALHAFTGCDCTSAFVRKGKLKPLKVLQTNPQFLPVFENLGSCDTDVADSTITDLQQFVCFLYGKRAITDVNTVRFIIFRSRSEAKSSQHCFNIRGGIDLSLLPPCLSALYMHILRSCYQAYIWKHAHVAYANVPSPVGHGWKLNNDGQLVIDWIDGDIMPAKLVDVLAEANTAVMSTQNTDDLEEDDTYHILEDDAVDNMLDVVFEDEEED